MKIVVSTNEVVALGEYALKCHHISTAVGAEIHGEVCTEALSMTDAEITSVVLDDAMAAIHTIGGKVRALNADEYIIDIPEEFVVDQLEKSKQVTIALVPLMVKAYKFGMKYREFFEGLMYKLRTYEIFKVGFFKGLHDDINDLKGEMAKAESEIDKLIKRG